MATLTVRGRNRLGAVAAIAGLLLVAAPAAAQRISAGLGLGLTFVGGVAGALDGGIVSAPAAAAYSFRLLRTAYLGTGAAVRLRRASDNAESDIGFSGSGDFDTAAAATHCNATTCFIAKWYDQSGNARDLVQATAANQPAYVASCVAAKPCFQLTAATHQLASAANLTPATGVMSLGVVTNRVSGAFAVDYLTANGPGLAGNRLNGRNPAGFQLAGGTSGSVFTSDADATWHAAAGAINGASSFLNVDGTVTSAAAVGNTAAGVISLQGAGTVVANETEAIVWDNYVLTATEAAALTANQRAYWTF